ncbi:trafficking protein particle complex subunit 10 [Halyomorpha halys]|uniref:trafficking protein particle complex subunit 10 n=1 Tax=Halyomorpha halys TaxID=286706 RepID=UPI0006D50DB3|nr:trafficking protein particle complex subunit 10 [Halyomorpha halys]
MNSHVVMNGTMDRVTEVSVSDRKPIVTYAGDKELFLGLEPTLCSSLPQEAAEWRRAYGRAIKSVNVSAMFVSFTKDVLPKDGDYHLINQPMFHTYWTQCSDVELYKSNVREDIELWMSVLQQFKLSEWMIVVVETYDFRKSNKLLPRTTVYDKIKSDFGAKHADRCLSVINPLRSESRSAGSWRGLVVNTRLLLLAAFDRILLKFEETLREQRDRRNQVGWSFTKYFLLQEELAFVLEMLGVYEEALVQYDELDALFTQFIVNSNLGETPAWLTQFQTPLESWQGLSLTSGVNLKERSRIENNSCSLLQFRNYLFSRQCAMLLYSNKPSEVAERTLPFLHNCIRELYMLEVACPVGSVPTWVFLSSIEILQICDTYTDSVHVEQYSRYTAGIWAYARQKLSELGKLCGLMPGQVPSSEQLHLAVEIFSGLGEANTKPVEKLKRALSNHQEFYKMYLELSELAMGTYKHIGRVRCARSLGQDLSDFYRVLGDDQTAASFLQLALLSYDQDGWAKLAAVTRLRLASSYLALGDLHRYTKMCLSIACSTELDMPLRMKHYSDALNTISTSKPDPPWSCCLTDCFTLTDVDVQVHQGGMNVSATLGIRSLLPVETVSDSVSMAISQYKHESKSSSKHKEALENSRRKSLDSSSSSNLYLLKIPMTLRHDYQQDKSLAGSSLEVKNTKQIVRRQDSHGKYRKISNIAKADFTRYLSAKKVVLKPGLNSVHLSCKESEAGQYRLGQCCITLMDGFELLSPPLPQKVIFEVSHIQPAVLLLNHGDMLAGLVQDVTLKICSNSYNIAEDTKVKLKASIGLELKDGLKDWSRVLELKLPAIKPNSSLELPLKMYAELPNIKDCTNLEHNVMVKNDWSEEEHAIGLNLKPVLSSKLSMQTSKYSKFLHVAVSSVTSLSIESIVMTPVSSSNVVLIPLNPNMETTVLTPERKIFFMWKMDIEKSNEHSQFKTELTLRYNPTSGDTTSKKDYIYKCTFDIVNYKTIYLLECRVEPIRGSEFCRVSTVCQLKLKVTKVNKESAVADPDCNSLMYEVLTEHNMWAACGRTAGVLNLADMDEQTVLLDVMPLVNGYLPLPSVRLSKYIPAGSKSSSGRSEGHPRLEPFSAGQVYNLSKSSQVHVISAASPQDP